MTGYHFTFIQERILIFNHKKILKNTMRQQLYRINLSMVNNLLTLLTKPAFELDIFFSIPEKEQRKLSSKLILPYKFEVRTIAVS